MSVNYARQGVCVSAHVQKKFGMAISLFCVGPGCNWLIVRRAKYMIGYIKLFCWVYDYGESISCLSLLLTNESNIKQKMKRKYLITINVHVFRLLLTFYEIRIIT